MYSNHKFLSLEEYSDTFVEFKGVDVEEKVMGMFGDQTCFSLKYSSGGDTPDMTFWVRFKLDNELH